MSDTFDPTTLTPADVDSLEGHDLAIAVDWWVWGDDLRAEIGAYPTPLTAEGALAMFDAGGPLATTERVLFDLTPREPGLWDLDRYEWTCFDVDRWGWEVDCEWDSPPAPFITAIYRAAVKVAMGRKNQ